MSEEARVQKHTKAATARADAADDEVASDTATIATGSIDPGSMMNDDEVATTGKKKKPRRPFRFSLKLLVVLTVTYFFVFPLVPDFKNAWTELRRVDPLLLVLGLVLENLALWCYAPLMQAALGDVGKQIRRTRLYRIQMSTRALQSIVPGGSAASTALGYRLMTLSGVAGPDAGFALATVGLGSALVLNIILWIGLIISIPIRGVNPIYGTVAVIGVIIMMIAAGLVFGLMEGQGRSERAVRWIARHVHVDEDKAATALHRVAERLEQLISEPRLLARVVMWASLNWLLDCASLWVFLRAFGVSMDVDAIIIAFGIANVLAAIPITPGGLGYVDLSLIGTLVGFGARRRQVALAIPAYRVAQLFLPIITGGLLYLSLRVGPWKIERRDRLKRLRDVAEEETIRGESKLDFQLRFPTRDALGRLIRPSVIKNRSEPSNVDAVADGVVDEDNGHAEDGDGDHGLDDDGHSADVRVDDDVHGDDVHGDDVHGDDVVDRGGGANESTTGEPEAGAGSRGAIRTEAADEPMSRTDTAAQVLGATTAGVSVEYEFDDGDIDPAAPAEVDDLRDGDIDPAELDDVDEIELADITSDESEPAGAAGRPARGRPTAE